MCIINFAGAEQSFQRVVSRDYKASKVDEEFAPDVKEDEEEVEADKTEKGIDLGNIGLFLEVIENGVL